MTTRADVARRVAYGAAFVVGVPILLVLWARRSAPMIALPALGGAWIGAMVALPGLVLVGAGIGALIRRGGGLPMNAFPPPRLVRAGVFAWVRDPIYLGFGLVVLGASLAARSASGLWLVTPATWLAMAALVFGYERHDLRRRFGDAALAPTRLALPRGAGTPTFAERAATMVWLFGPWLLAYYAVQALGRSADSFTTVLAAERGWPVVPWMELPYASAYVVVPAAVLLARSRRALRTFAMGGMAATAVVTLCWLVIPVVAVHRPFTPSDWAGRLLVAEWARSRDVAAFPAFHVLWTLLAARALSADRALLARAAAWGWAALVAVSCVGTSHHGMVDVAAAALLYWPLRDPAATWETIRRATERVANSWREWRIGALRFISHGAYAGLAAGVGVTIAGCAAGPGNELAVPWVAVWVLVGAGAYAQVLEGSSRLLRPFGWYGGMIGGIVGIATSRLAGGAPVSLAAACVLAAPWIQSLGRLRCLVQGCCHGKPTSAATGIRYRHPRSRVTQLAHLASVPIHATPLYSIAGNLVIGVVLLRLRALGAPDTLLVGVYFLLSGCARFVEESYRGEPQTPLVGGLRVYQWFAVATVMLGVACTMIVMPPPAAGLAAPSPRLLALAAVVCVLFAAAMGLDFPRSDRRFSRLAAAD